MTRFTNKLCKYSLLSLTLSLTYIFSRYNWYLPLYCSDLSENKHVNLIVFKPSQVSDSLAVPKLLTYDDRGKLVHDGFTFSCHNRNTDKLLAFWRCTMYKKRHCTSALTTHMKAIKSIRGFHNHEPPERLKTFIPRVVNWQSRGGGKKS